MDTFEAPHPHERSTTDADIPVRILIPVWGTHYIQRFCQLGLPTLLAPGNLPAFAGMFRCEVIFLTRADEEVVFRDLRAFQELEKICAVSFIDINDPIADTTYTVTITAAYVRGMRSTGEAMVDTHFVFLVSDYLMADGSLRRLGRYIKEGYNGIMAGNFQAVTNYLSETVQELIDEKTQALSLPPRRLLKIAFEDMHPVTVANMVDYGTSYAMHSNRFFWRVDKNTLLGRFFLLHMLCIKPETADFEIGSSCDYSFIPEMCPSGNVTAIEDSDEYLVVELQDLRHESGFLEPGIARERDLINHYSEWVTEQHRRNADYRFLYHVDALPPNVPDVIAESDKFIQRLKSKLTPTPQPHRGHPYWLAALASYEQERGYIEESDHTQLLLSLEKLGARPSFLLAFARKAFRFLFGTAPHVYPWHHAWRDYAGITESLTRKLEDPEYRLVAISETTTPFTRWLAGYGDRVVNLQTTRFLTRPGDFENLENAFDCAFVYLLRCDFPRLRKIVKMVAPTVKSGGTVYFFFDSVFGHELVVDLAAMFQLNFRLVGVQYNASWLRMLTRTVLERANRRISASPVAGILTYAPILLLTSFFVLIDNFTMLRKPRKLPEVRSSAIFTFEVE